MLFSYESSNVLQICLMSFIMYYALCNLGISDRNSQSMIDIYRLRGSVLNSQNTMTFRILNGW